MNTAIFRFVVPSYLGVLVVALAVKRWLVRRRLDWDPVRMRPGHDFDLPGGFLEWTLTLATLVDAADVALNAVWPGQMARLAIPVLRESAFVAWTGVGLLTLGLVLILAAVAGMGESWRIGIDRERPGALVTSGLFDRIRHPIYSGIFLLTLGLALLTADVLSIAVAAAAAVGLPVQARLEEQFLGSVHPDYASYQRRTGRFWPRSRS